MTGFRTPRLTVARWEQRLDDAATRPGLESWLAEILTPAVLAHLPPDFGPGDGPGAMAEWIALRRSRASISLVETAAAPIGLLFVFRPDPASPDLHVGYLLSEAAWGQGYATELLRGLLANLRGNDPLTLRARVARDNPASARVLLKAGFAADPAPEDADLQAFTLHLPPG